MNFKGYSLIHDSRAARFSVNTPDPILVAAYMAEGLTDWQAEEIARNEVLRELWGTAEKSKKENLKESIFATPLGLTRLKRTDK